MAPQFKGGVPGGSGRNIMRLKGRVLPLRTAALAVGAAAAVGGVGALHHHHRTARLQHSQHGLAFLLPRGLAEVICGAVGEIVQVACLYPLDTIKVRCQATSSSAGKVVADMLRANGGILAPALWRQLYAGVVGASLLSVAVGALYYSSFCAAKRHLLRWTADNERRAAARAAAAGAADALPLPGLGAGGSAAALAGDHPALQHHPAHGPPVDYHHDAVVAMVCSTEAAARRAEQAAVKKAASRKERKERRQREAAVAGAGAEPGQASLLAASAAAESSGAASGSERASGSEVAEDAVSSGGRLRANMAAATAAALVGAVVEAPVELFKHQLQAGHISGSILGHMGAAVRAGGPAALFVSMLPFCMKSLPFDSVELLTYSSLSDAREALGAAPAAGAGAGPGAGLRERLVAAARAARDHPCLDLGIGAAAGAAAVLISQPMDTVKTCIETGSHLAAAPGAAPAGSGRAFVEMGRQLVAKHGPGALFAGMSMRLAEQVPSTALYWIAVEGTRRALEPYVAK